MDQNNSLLIRPQVFAIPYNDMSYRGYNGGGRSHHGSDRRDPRGDPRRFHDSRREYGGNRQNYGSQRYHSDRHGENGTFDKHNNHGNGHHHSSGRRPDDDVSISRGGIYQSVKHFFVIQPANTCIGLARSFKFLIQISPI